MSDEDSNATPSLKAGYIISIILLTLGSFAMYSFAPLLIALALNGPVSFADLFQTSVPMVEHSALWQGKLYVPSQKISPFNPAAGQQSLTIFDIATGKSKVMMLQQVPSQISLVADESGLWGVAGSTVIRLQGDDVTPATSGTTLKAEPIFIHKGKLATIIDSPKASQRSLLTSQLWVWTGSSWQNAGELVLPAIVDAAPANEDSNPPDAPAPTPFKGTNKIRVATYHGQNHIFCSDGTNVLYSSQLEVIPAGSASALATENAPSSLQNWISAGTHRDFQVGADAQGLLLVEHKVDMKNVGMRTTSTIMRLVGGVWTQQSETERSGFVIDPQLVSDGQQAFIVNQSINDKLILTNIQVDGTKVSLPLNSGLAMERLTVTTQKYWWIPLLILLFYAATVTWLMNIYCSSQYEYGNSTVELAPVLRRTLAKGVDWFLISGPLMALQWFYIGSQQQAQEWWKEFIGAMDLNTVKMLFLGLAGLALYFLVWLIGLGIFEGKWGISPGKWLFGLRVVRTTLRPCGFFRAVLREIFVLLDGVLCFGWLPGAFTITLSRCRQRLGDLVSDTIVIRKPVIPKRLATL